MKLRRRWDASHLFWVAFIPYVGGLLVWLALGLVPPLAQASGAFRSLLAHLAVNGGVWGRLSHQALISRLMAADGRWVIVDYGFSLLNLVLGITVVVLRPRHLVARLLALATIGTAATFNAPSHVVFHVLGEPAPIAALHFTFHIVSGTAYTLAVVLFPDGRLVPFLHGSARRALQVAVGVAVAAVTLISWRSSFVSHPPFFVAFFGALTPAVGIPAQAYRMRRSPSMEEHQQSRLLCWGLLPGLGVALVWSVAEVIALAGGRLSPGAHQVVQVAQFLFPAVFALVPATLFLALIRYRLWDVDLVISRALLYGALAGGIGLGYVAVVSVTALLLGPTILSAVAATALVAVAVEPARRRLARWANRVVFGQELTPAEAVRTLADRLGRFGPEDELAELARVIVLGTRAAGAEVWLEVDGWLRRVAAWPVGEGEGLVGSVGSIGPTKPAEPGRGAALPLPHGSFSTEAVASLVAADRVVPVSYRGSALGVLALQLRVGTSLRPAEVHLVEELAGHAGLLLHNARLGAQLAQHVEELDAQTTALRLARQRAVDSGDAERRRLERDLHDGAQQDLVAVALGLRSLLGSRGAGQDTRPAGAPDTRPAGAPDTRPAGAPDTRPAGAPDTRPAGTPETRGAGAPDNQPSVADLASLLQATSSTLSELCRSTYPPALAHGGLAGALEQAAARARRAGLDVTVRFDATQRQHPEAETAVYFSCLEALQNATKHSGGTKAEVVVELSAHELRFAIRDDGVGFDPARTGPSSGLPHLSERLALLGGTLVVESAPGQGTTLRGSIPRLTWAAAP